MQVIRDVEEYLLRVADEEHPPHPRECVLCYLARMLHDHDCDSTLRWTGRFRELRSPSATGLEERMRRTDGSCDCTIVARGYRLTREHLVRDLATDELEPPERPPPCTGVGRLDSTRPCRVWERNRGGR